MIDTKMVELVRSTQAKLTYISPNAHPSQILDVKKAFGKAFLALLKDATNDITPEQKIAAFDKLAKSHIDSLITAVEGALANGSFYHDEDEDHYTWEEVRIAVLGPRAFEATNTLNALDELLP